MAEWTVLVFGDSWAKYSHPTWPEVLARRIGGRCVNLAIPGDVSQGLQNQASQALMSPQVPKAAGGMLRRETLVVVHTGGNDFIQKISQVAMAMFGGPMPNIELFQPNPGRREAELICNFMETMYRAGARHFLISGVPAFIHMPIFNMLWGIVQQLVNERKLESIGISPGDPPQLVVEVQAAAINERWSEMVDSFAKSHSEARCHFFNETEALERMRHRLGETVCDRQCWDFSMFHPSPYGHEQIADEAKQCIDQVQLLATTASAAGQTTSSQAQPASPAPAAPKATLPEAPITIQVKNVKGTASFSNANGTVSELREAILAAAPAEARGSKDGPCALVFKGQVLKEGPGPVAEMGLADGSLVVFVVKAADRAA
eukprot:CAMPEP_0178460578 /NCGR_PEP_ID=MMETSP0689_2-20121128/48791_1 /TAXON_ID=160604 /ORGANISM="Amphidinium massartii, Strain CS-259" /LENGTH=373 /DNA_ID=CAMNT_0020087237 /DNA_START=20 /DNA_END=1142 /DNA_ORIENTATION=+